MAREDYEILPHSLLEDLKYDVEALKKKLQEPETKTNELILEIESMKDSIHELNEVFKKALDTTHDEDIFKAVKNMNERIDAVVTQNETIARGMIAISDKVDQFIASSSGGSSRVAPSLSKSNVSPGPMHPAAVQAPPPGPSPQMMSASHSGMVPPPPSMGTPSHAGVGGIPPPPGPPPKSTKRHGFF